MGDVVVSISNFDDVAGTGGVDDLVVADIHDHVLGLSPLPVGKEQVAGGKVFRGDESSLVDLLVGSAAQGDSGVGVGLLHQAGAVTVTGPALQGGVGAGASPVIRGA